MFGKRVIHLYCIQGGGVGYRQGYDFNHLESGAYDMIEIQSGAELSYPGHVDIDITVVLACLGDCLLRVIGHRRGNKPYRKIGPNSCPL